MRNLILNISPPKCGTTSLYFSLVASRHIAQSVLKEPRYFAKADQGPGGLPDAMRCGGNYANGKNWHNELFRGESGEAYRIDFTTYYAVTRDTPKLVKNEYPNAKLIMVLRDPISRFVSQYYQYLKMGIEMPAIDDVIHGDTAVSHLMHDFADYRGTFERYADSFGESSVLILDFRALKAQIDTIGSALNGFLGVDDIHYSPSELEKNVAGRPRFGLVQRALFSDKTRNLMRHVSPALKTRLLTVRKRIILANVKPKKYPDLTDTQHAALAERLADATEFFEQNV